MMSEMYRPGGLEVLLVIVEEGTPVTVVQNARCMPMRRSMGQPIGNVLHGRSVDLQLVSYIYISNQCPGCPAEIHDGSY